MASVWSELLVKFQWIRCHDNNNVIMSEREREREREMYINYSTLHSPLLLVVDKLAN